jgi:carbonic anhydrase
MKSLTRSLLLAGVLLCVGCASTAPMNRETQAALTPAAALERLKEGNRRFVTKNRLVRDHNRHAALTAGGQYPFATVLSCIDSRTSSELIFDQGIGDIFNARVAGNVVNPDILGSLEFGTAEAGSKLIAVIGHTRCGAVSGACNEVRLGNLTGLLQRIAPAVKATPSAQGEDRTAKNPAFVDRVVETNVRLTVEAIRRGSPLLREQEREGKVAIVGGVHDLVTGKVTFLP